jgi:hypothetical protein
MEQAVITSIIAGLFAVISAIVTLVVKKRIEDAGKEPISDDLRTALTGRWEVHSHQPDGPGGVPLDLVFILTLRVKGNAVEGVFTLSLPLPGSSEIPSTASGSLTPDRFLKLEYKARDTALLQFGHMLFHLGDGAKIMSGTFSGYGHITQGPIHGTLTAKKIG